uniref:Arm DNA-binding domain-containing protein n=1 Tax=Sphingomonas sp. BAUL-RG-20F-R05-02 TaxID=2914830 RepID=UPI00391F9A9D
THTYQTVSGSSEAVFYRPFLSSCVVSAALKSAHWISLHATTSICIWGYFGGYASQLGRSIPNGSQGPKARYATKRAKDYKLTDGQGLYLLVRPNGSKLWRMKYRFGDKEKLTCSPFSGR